MSQRADILNDTPGLLELELAAGKRSYTLGIEGISRRLRAYLQKGLEESPVRQLLARLLAGGAREVKLFYLLTGYEEPRGLRGVPGLSWAGCGARSASADCAWSSASTAWCACPSPRWPMTGCSSRSATGSPWSGRRARRWNRSASSGWPPPGRSTPPPRCWPSGATGCTSRWRPWPRPGCATTGSCPPPPGGCCPRWLRRPPAGRPGAGRRKARGLPLPPGLRAHPGGGRGAPRAVPQGRGEPGLRRRATGPRRRQ